LTRHLEEEEEDIYKHIEQSRMKFIWKEKQTEKLSFKIFVFVWYPYIQREVADDSVVFVIRSRRWRTNEFVLAFFDYFDVEEMKASDQFRTAMALLWNTNFVSILLPLHFKFNQLN